MKATAADEDVHYINKEIYRQLEEWVGAAARRGASEVSYSDIDVPKLLYQEARLLDGRQYRSWLQLLDERCLYWVPSNPVGGDPGSESGINFDDRRRLVDRITLIETGVLHTQHPPTRTCRVISNVEAWRMSSDLVDCFSNITIWASRKGNTRSFVGRQMHQLINVKGHWKIKNKVIILLDSDEPQPDITFIL